MPDPADRSTRRADRSGPTERSRSAGVRARSASRGARSADRSRTAEPADGADLTVLGELGRGGHTVTYRVRRGDDEYAMKVLHQRPGPDGFERAFHREAALLAAVNDPGIARVHEVGRWHGQPYLLMDLIRGRPLSAVLTAGPLPVQRLLSVGIDVGLALQAAHRVGVVHRDIKPDNILLADDGRRAFSRGVRDEDGRRAFSRGVRDEDGRRAFSRGVRDQDGVARLIDFGLAVRLGEADDDTATGTMLYCAPEQAGMFNRPVDGRADLYALGAVLFEAATGQPPFRSDDVGELLRMHASAALPDPRARRPDLPAGLAAIIARLLAKDPDDRYQSALGLVADLRRVQADPDTRLGTAALPLGGADAPTSSTPAFPLVGRSAELSILDSRWAEVSQGHGGAVLIEGPTGVGKSRLAKELTRIAAAAGALVLVGKGEPDQSVPLAPLRVAIERHVRSVLARPEPARGEGIADIVAAAGPAAALLRRLSPTLGSVLRAPTLAEDDRQQQFSAAVAGFLIALARSHGAAVLHLDDGQWLDDATRKVLAQLAPQLAQAPLLVLATARIEPGPPDAPASAVGQPRAPAGLPPESTVDRESTGPASPPPESTVDSDSSGPVGAVAAALGPALDVRLRLAPLSEPAVAELVASVSGGLAVDEVTAAGLAARSDGNPFTLLQYLETIVDSGLLRPSWGRWLVDEDELQSLDLPGSGRELVLGRLDGLDAESRYLLGVAAVLGPRFTLELVAKVCGVPHRRVRTVVSIAEARNLVERRDGGRYGFLHDQIREALAARFDEATRRGVHQRIADVLDAIADPQPRTVYALARHCQLAGLDRDPARARRTCRAAGRLALADQAPAEALDFLCSAVAAAELLGEQPDPDLLATLGVAQHRMSRFHDAVDTFGRAHTHSTEAVERARVLGLTARVHDSMWNTAEQAESVQRALAELGRPLPGNRFALVVSTAWFFLIGLLVGFTHLGYGTAKGAKRERYQLLTSLYDTAALAYTRQLRPNLSLVFCLRELYPVNRLGPGPERVRMDIACAHLALVAGQKWLARRLTDRAWRGSAALGDPRLQAYVDWLYSLDRYFFGFDQGESIRSTLVEQSRWLDAGQTGDLLLVLPWDALLRGDLREAQDLYDRRAELLQASRQPGRMAVHTSRAGLLALAGRGDEATAHLEGMRADRPHPLPWERVDLLYGDLLTAVERYDVGPAFDEAAEQFAALGVGPLLLVPPQRGLYAYLAYGRLEQARLARARLAGEATGDPAAGDELARRVAAARTAVKQFRRAANIPILRAHYRVARAALHEVSGRPEQALAELNASEPVLRAVDGALVWFEAARVRAHALRALHVVDEADRQARFALGLAVEQGWSDRADHTVAEFGLSPAANSVPARRPATASPGPGAGAAGLYRERLAAIEQVGLAASRVLDPAKLVAIALDETVRILGAERAFLFLTDPDDSSVDSGTGSTGELVPQRGRDADGNDIDQLSGYSASLVERVRRSREPLVLTSTEEGEALGAQSVVLHGLRSVLVAPLQLDGRLLGVVYLDSRVAKGIFSAEDVGVLVAITNHIAIALETARAAQLEVAVEAANRERDLAQAMRDALAEIAGPLESTPDEVLRRLLTTVRRFVGCDSAWLIRAGAGAGQPEGVANVLDGQSLEWSTMDIDPALTRVLEVTGSDPVAVAGPPALAATVPPAAHWLAVPLVARGDRVGILLLASTESASYDQGRAEIVTALVGQAMVAYENARLFEQVRRLATIDSLTGIANRSSFFTQADRALATARRHDRRVAAMMIDIDHFKRVNDNYGHQVGDEVIHAVADRLRAGAREDDLVGRYGGEEFAVVVAEGDGDAVAAAERLRAVIAASPVSTGVGPLAVTVSVGVTYQHDDDANLNDVLARADRCLMRAKRSGRDRVFFA